MYNVPTSGWEVTVLFSWNAALCHTCFILTVAHHNGDGILFIHWLFTRNLCFIANMGVHNWSFLCSTCKTLYLCLRCLPMSESSNCTHIINGTDDLHFSSCISFLQDWAPFNSPSLIDIFVIMPIVSLQWLETHVINLLWFLHISSARHFLAIVVCIVRHQMVVHLCHY